MKRRDLLAAAPVGALAGFLSAGNVAVATEIVLAETPVMQAFHQWKARRDELSGLAAGLSDEEYGDLLTVVDELGRVVMTHLPMTPRDLVAQMIAGSDFGVKALPEDDEVPAFWAEARALVGVPA